MELDTATDVTPGVSASAETNAALARCAVSGTKLTTEWEREGANGDVVMATSTVSNVLVIANSDGVVEAWSTEPQTNQQIVRPYFRVQAGEGIRSVAISDDGQFVALASDLGVEILDLQDGRREAVMDDGDSLTSAVVSRRSSFDTHAASGGELGVHVRSASGSGDTDLAPVLDEVNHLSYWNGSSHLIAAGQVDGIAALAVYPQGGLSVTAELPFAGSMETVLQLSDGRYLFAGMTEDQGFIVEGEMNTPHKPRYNSVAIAERSIESLVELDGAIASFGEGRLEIWESETLGSLGGFNLGSAIHATVDAASQTVLAVYADGTQRLMACEL